MAPPLWEITTNLKIVCYFDTVSRMSFIVEFNITRADGWFTAEGLNIPVVTQSTTLRRLRKNIREVVELYFEEGNPEQ